MKKILTFISLLFLSVPAMATCNYSDTGNGASVGFSITSKILSDPTLPAGTVLAAKSVGGQVTNTKTFSNCGINDIYAIIASPSTTLVTGVKGVLGGPVYETGIPGIGFEISEAITGTVSRPVPATLGSVSAYGLSSSPIKQISVWLIKTNEAIDTSYTGTHNISVSYRAGTVNQVNSNSSAARLLRVDLTLGPFTFKETSCDITPRGGNTINLSSIEASQLKSTAQGGVTSKQKEFTLDISCPTSSIGTKYTYWFNAITENSTSKDGVLLNNISEAMGGAKDVGFIIKQGNSPIKFFDFNSYIINNVQKSQSLTFKADYYKISNSLTPGPVQAIFEIVLQEN